MSETTTKNKTIIVLGIGLIAVSVSSILIKLCDAPALVIATYRLTLASVFYLGYTGIKQGKFWRTFSRGQIKTIFISAIFLTIHFSTWITSLKYTSVASSVILVQSAPIFVAFGSFIFLKERPSALLMVGAVIALFGSIMISVLDYSQDKNAMTGNLLAIGGAIGAAGYLLAGRKIRSQVNLFSYVSAVYSLTAVALLILAILNGASFFGFSTEIYLLFFAIAIFPQIIGHTSLNWALKYFSATAISIAILAEPIGASILAVFVLGEQLTVVKIFWGIVILSGVLIALIAETKNNRN
ncbi:DMT family transporter [candidate division KSB1 bacterium]|nr:DMT family transporter [candidate division KSB1 bacterium]MBL7094915.1 DMT family transporter [candidate division KSB1 bacterium]